MRNSGYSKIATIKESISKNGEVTYDNYGDISRVVDSISSIVPRPLTEPEPIVHRIVRTPPPRQPKEPKPTESQNTQSSEVYSKEDKEALQKYDEEHKEEAQLPEGEPTLPPQQPQQSTPTLPNQPINEAPFLTKAIIQQDALNKLAEKVYGVQPSLTKPIVTIPSGSVSDKTTGQFPGRPITGARNYNNKQLKAGDHEVEFTEKEIQKKEQFYKFFNLVVPGDGAGNQELLGVQNIGNVPKHTLKPKNSLIRGRDNNMGIRFGVDTRVPAEKPFEYKITKKALESRRASMFCDVGQMPISWIRDVQSQYTGPISHMLRDSYEPTPTLERNSINTRLAHPNVIIQQNGRIVRI